MRWIALLRGVNVGGRSVVPMAELRTLLADLGLEDVRTVIQSGNAVFDGPRGLAATTIERAVDERFGVSTAVMLRTPDRLRELVDGHPFGRDASKTHVLFLREAPPAAGVARLAERDAGGARFEVDGSDVYVSYPEGVGRAKLPTVVLERHLGPGTLRNWRTVMRLAELG